MDSSRLNSLCLNGLIKLSVSNTSLSVDSSFMKSEPSGIRVCNHVVAVHSEKLAPV